jgi:hypothetical protein
LAAAGPLEFGKSELNAALAARGMEPALLRLITEINGDPTESYRIDGKRIFGGDIRGLMYGLLEAAEQIRTAGRLSTAKGSPAVPIRGIRIAFQNHPKGYWQDYIRMLARNRFNRLNMVFAQTPSVDQIDEISQTAADHAMDFTLSLPGDSKDLPAILAKCKSIRAIHLQTNPTEALQAIRNAGHLVALEIDDTQANPDLIEVARTTGIPVRRSSIFYKPFQSKFLWGDPDYVRRIVPTLGINDAAGFELDAPADNERHWLLYMLWGRLSYDSKTPDKVWMTELQRRFGPAAADVMEAYRNTTIEAPNTKVKEAVQNRIKGIPSAKQTPLMAASHLQKLSLNLEQAVERIKKSIDPENKEWKTSEDDFLTLAAIAKYHCRMQMAADQLEVFEQTGADSGLYAAQRELRGAARQWDLIANKYPLPQPDVKQVEERVKQYEQSEHPDQEPQRWPPTHLRPAMEHIPPPFAIANQPLPLILRLPHGYKVRLYYGPNLTIMENETGHFTIPAEAMQLKRDLTYYFEILSNQGSGWFQPDPQTQTPFYIVRVQPAPPPKEDPGKLPSTAASK